MIKWIGQHIWDFVSRFRNDVYLENISSGTIVSGGTLGLDSDNKIVKAFGRIWQTVVHGYATDVTSTTDYHHRLSSTYLNWSGTTTDPTTFNATHGVIPFFIAHVGGKITKINIQGESSTTDSFKFYFYKASASNNQANMTLTLMGSTAAITPDSANKSYSYQGSVDFSFATNQRLYVFYKKDNNTGSTNNYYAISISGEFT